MTKPKLPPARDWQARDIDDWNTQTFCAYLTDKHHELFGIDYAPFRGWRTEQGMIGAIIGTAGKNPKPRTASNAALKRFIDVTFAAYRPTAQYPGTSFGFMWSYRKTDWQRIQADELRRQQAEDAHQDAPSLDELGGWF